MIYHNETEMLTTASVYSLTTDSANHDTRARISDKFRKKKMLDRMCPNLQFAIPHTEIAIAPNTFL